MTPFRSTKSMYPLLLSVVTLVGCGQDGPPLGGVSGTVTLDGQPLPHARVEFQPTEPGGSPSYATTDVEGKYELIYGVDRPGALLGTHVVRITSARLDRSDDGTLTEIPERVPPNYNEETELQKTVESGDQVIDFQLTGALDA